MNTKEIKILHVIDDEKFIGMCKLTFEGLENVNNKYISCDELNNTIIRNSDFLIIHFLKLNIAKKIINIQSSAIIIWFVWGSDIYTLGKFSNVMLNSRAKWLRCKISFKKGLRSGLNNTVKTLFPSSIDKYPKKDILKAIHKINGIACHMPEEINLIKKAYGFDKDYFVINYVNPIVTQAITKPADIGANILLGNSSSFENNHIEILDKLQKNKNLNEKIIVPLSYGNVFYRNYIVNHVKKKKMNNIHFLIDFLPYDDYQKIIKSCGVMIMNHKRQQALGNIVQALMEGLHVYMNEYSSVYKYLNNSGFLISKVSELDDLRLLTHEEKVHNIKKTKYYFGKAQQIKLLNKIFKHYGYKENKLQN